MIIQTNKKTPKRYKKLGMGDDNEKVHSNLYNLARGGKRFFLEKNMSGRDSSGMI